MSNFSGEKGHPHFFPTTMTTMEEERIFFFCTIKDDFFVCFLTITVED